MFAQEPCVELIAQLGQPVRQPHRRVPRDACFDLHLRRGVVHGIGQPLAPGTAVVIDQQVSGNLGQPGRKRSLFGLIAPGIGAVNAQKNFLAEIFGRRRVPSEAVTQVVYAPRVALHQGSHAEFSVAPQARLNQLGVELQYDPASLTPSLPGLTPRNANTAPKVP